MNIDDYGLTIVYYDFDKTRRQEPLRSKAQFQEILEKNGNIDILKGNYSKISIHETRSLWHLDSNFDDQHRSTIDINNAFDEVIEVIKKIIEKHKNKIEEAESLLRSIECLNS